MKIVFWHSDKPREHILSEAFADGVRKHGDEIQFRALTGEPEVVPDTSVACMFGVKSRALFHAHWNAGVHVVYIDKGYTRHKADGPIRIWEYWRVAVDAHNPTKFLARESRPSDRWDALGLEFLPWRKRGDHVVFAGSSAKYNEFYHLSDPTKYAAKVIQHLAGVTGRKIVYRPKPSWRDAVPIDGSTYSKAPETIHDVLTNAHALVTHGSNACFEAMLAGVPTIVVGEAVAKPISSTELEAIEKPRLASDEERKQLLSNLAYCQWTLPEFASGEAWATIRPQIYG